MCQTYFHWCDNYSQLVFSLYIYNISHLHFILLIYLFPNMFKLKGISPLVSKWNSIGMLFSLAISEWWIISYVPNCDYHILHPYGRCALIANTIRFYTTFDIIFRELHVNISYLLRMKYVTYSLFSRQLVFWGMKISGIELQGSHPKFCHPPWTYEY